MTVSVVVGAGYGDEGKGLVTDWLCNKRTLNVRYNGGSQAGHTVITDFDQRHIFSHMGAGTFTGASTFLTSDFIVNPIFFNKEYDKLSERINKLRIYIDPNARITTPFDMMINVAREESRTERHGSCGAGIFETIYRDRNLKSFKLREIFDPRVDCEVHVRHLRDISENIIKELEIPKPDCFLDERLLQRYVDDLKLMRDRISPIFWSDLCKWHGDVVFEGAQGLMLCETNTNDMPHLTPSTTGIKWVLPKLVQRGSDQADIYYVSRTYMTRHGNGPMPHEYGAPYLGLRDKTNITNKHQGGLRYSYIDVDVLRKAINRDFNETREYGSIAFTKNLVLTWCDTIPCDGRVRYVKDGDADMISLGGFKKMLKDELGFDKIFTSFGPSASCITD